MNSIYSIVVIPFSVINIVVIIFVVRDILNRKNNQSCGSRCVYKPYVMTRNIGSV